LPRFRFVAAFVRGDRRTLFVMEQIGQPHRIGQRFDLAGRCPGVADMRNALLDRFERRLFGTIADKIGRIAGVHILSRPVAEQENILLQRRGRLIEPVSLLDRRPFAVGSVRGQQHRRARRDRQHDRRGIGPVGDCRQTHAAPLIGSLPL
jgi:hypothetical protein